MISKTVRFHGATMTRGDLEDLLAEGDTDPATRVTVRVATTSSHPTDPGGEITIEMPGR